MQSLQKQQAMPDLLIKDLVIDWSLFRNQKLTILNLINNSDDIPVVEDLEGVINLMNHIQDQALQSEIWTEEEIFGETKEDQYFEWEEKYKPIKNHFEGRNGSYSDTMFETFGEEVEYVWAQDVHHVWTLIEGDEGQYIAAGRHHINRLGYFITEIAWTDETEEYYSE